MSHNIDVSNSYGADVIQSTHELETGVTHTTGTNVSGGIEVLTEGTGLVDITAVSPILAGAGGGISFMAILTPSGLLYDSNSFQVFNTTGGSNRFLLRYSQNNGHKTFRLEARGNFGTEVILNDADHMTSDGDLNQQHVLVGTISEDSQILIDNGDVIGNLTTAMNAYTEASIPDDVVFLDDNFKGLLESLTFFDAIYTLSELQTLSADPLQIFSEGGGPTGIPIFRRRIEGY